MKVFLLVCASLIGIFLLYNIFFWVKTFISSLFVKKGKEYQKNSRYYRRIIVEGAFWAIFYCKIKLHSIFKGKPLSHKEMLSIITGHEITVEFDKPIAAQIDGETVLNVTCVKSFLK